MDCRILEAFELRLKRTAHRLADTRARIIQSSGLMDSAPELERTFLHRLRFVSSRRRKVRVLLKVAECLDLVEVVLLLGVDPRESATETQTEIVNAIQLARCEAE